MLESAIQVIVADSKFYIFPLKMQKNINRFVYPRLIMINVLDNPIGKPNTSSIAIKHSSIAIYHLGIDDRYPKLIRYTLIPD